MRCADLYDNHIRVNINNLKKLKRLKQLHQVLLMRNFLFGTLDDDFFHGWPRAWTYLNVALNRNVKGCIRPSQMPNWLTFSTGATGIIISEGCHTQATTRA